MTNDKWRYCSARHLPSARASNVELAPKLLHRFDVVRVRGFALDFVAERVHEAVDTARRHHAVVAPHVRHERVAAERAARVVPLAPKWHLGMPCWRSCTSLARSGDKAQLREIVRSQVKLRNEFQMILDWTRGRVFRDRALFTPRVRGREKKWQRHALFVESRGCRDMSGPEQSEFQFSESSPEPQAVTPWRAEWVRAAEDLCRGLAACRTLGNGR